MTISLSPHVRMFVCSSICSSICSSHFFNLKAFKVNFDVLIFQEFHKFFTIFFYQCYTAQGTTALGDNCTSQPFQVRFKWDKNQSWDSQLVKLVTKLVLIWVITAQVTIVPGDNCPRRQLHITQLFQIGFQWD